MSNVAFHPILQVKGWLLFNDKGTHIFQGKIRKYNDISKFYFQLNFVAPYNAEYTQKERFKKQYLFLI